MDQELEKERETAQRRTELRAEEAGFLVSKADVASRAAPHERKVSELAPVLLRARVRQLRCSLDRIVVVGVCLVSCDASGVGIL